jgi:predicted amidohydrolase
MPGDTYPKFRAAAVQAASVWLDRDATIEKMAALTSQTAHNGAALVVFPESYIPAFPVWNLTHRPLDQHAFFRRLYDQALLIPSAPFRKLAAIARSSAIYLSVGITEKTETSMGTLWNSNLLFSPEGQLVNWRRKLVATWAEKLTWAPGDAAGLKVVPTPLGRLGVLICGENTNTLARFTLLAQGEQVHIAPYPSLWPFNRPGSSQTYDLTQAIITRAAAHSFEGKLFTVVASGLLDEVGREDLARDNEEIRAVVETAPAPISVIVGPQGTPVAEPLVGQEGIVYAEIDISQNIEPRLAHDITGGYQRFDLFRLHVDQTPYTYVGVELADRSHYDPLALSRESEATGDATPQRKINRGLPLSFTAIDPYHHVHSPQTLDDTATEGDYHG